ncbi:MAG: chemotaxis protein CheV [Lachnospiraceae bacterium]|nr:chemotaxis protein CheV [Lachnospiraceae bacterium]
MDITLKDEISNLDLLIFMSGGNKYAINVSKVREILAYEPLTPIPKSHPYIEGMFMPRGELISVLDMRRVLKHSESNPGGYIIIANLSTQILAFHVDAIGGIFTTLWGDIMQPSEALGDEVSGLTTGIVKHDNELIMILDFEKILSDIDPELEIRLKEDERYLHRHRIDIPILVVEDSVLLNRLIVEALKKAGYNNITHAMNGREAWDMISKWREEGSLKEHIQCVITDLEMPRMDGHSLTKLIKEDNGTQWIKVVIFSSMINEAERAKGERLGADAQMSKPEIDLLVQKMDQMFEI